MVPPKYSIIVPVFNRPQELDDLLQSLTKQTFTNFEVLIVEDGSTLRSEKVFEKYSQQLLMQYYLKAVEKSLAENKLDAWGGPDRGHENFTAIQQAMAYTMSSIFTTGGIRGG